MCAFRLSTLDKYFKMSQAGTKMLNHMRNFSRIHSTLSQIFQRRQQLIWKLKCKLEGWEWNVHCMWSRKKNRHDTLLPVTGAKINETVLLLFFISLVDLLFYLRRPAKTSVNNEKTYMRFSYTFVWDCACVCVWWSVRKNSERWKFIAFDKFFHTSQLSLEFRARHYYLK